MFNGSISGFQPESGSSNLLDRSKNGHQIKFVYRDDIEGDQNRGWQVDLIEAFIEEQKVGYLKLSYIPRERFNRYYPSILNWLAQIDGKSILPYKKCALDPFKYLSAEEIKSVLEHMVLYYINVAGLDRRNVHNLSDDKLHFWLRKAETAMYERSEDRFEDFYAYFVDRPLVDYIHVEPSFRRLGIGTALYIAGAKWMAKKGMLMFASGIQQPEAAAAWDKMALKGFVKQMRMADKDRRYLDLVAVERNNAI